MPTTAEPISVKDVSKRLRWEQIDEVVCALWVTKARCAGVVHKRASVIDMVHVVELDFDIEDLLAVFAVGLKASS